MPKRSAGLLLFRRIRGDLEVFLVHPGGPFWAKKDAGVWTIPKGEYDDDEEALSAAQREFTEETSFVPYGPFLPLGEIKQKSGKLVLAWAFEGDCEPEKLVSNTCFIDWPPHSGKQIEIPEIDRGEWFDIEVAREKIRSEQKRFLDVLVATLS